eukprot:5967615-Prymnesium_polylepis.1
MLPGKHPRNVPRNVPISEGHKREPEIQGLSSACPPPKALRQFAYVLPINVQHEEVECWLQPVPKQKSVAQGFDSNPDSGRVGIGGQPGIESLQHI